MQIHVLTGADTTSGFFGRREKAVIKNVRKNIDEAKELLENFGKSSTMTKDCFKSVILFIVRSIYNDRKSLSLTELLCLSWKLMKKKSTQRLPPDEDSFRWHIMRSNSIIYTITNYMSSDIISSPSEHDWKVVDGKCFPICYEHPFVPESMSDSHYIITVESDEEENIIEENDIIDGFNQKVSSSDTDEFDEEYL